MKKVFTEEERIGRVWDNLEIKNVMARHVYYHEFGIHEKELDEIWVKDPEYAATASFGQSWGYQVGMEQIRKYYAPSGDERGDAVLASLRKTEPDTPDDRAYRAAGMAGMHTLSTPVIQIAEDGKTAQGMWYTPGQLTFTEFNEDGGIDECGCVWMFEKYAVDFVKEDGEWKIWHLFVGTDFACGIGEKFADQPQFGADGGPPEDPDDPAGFTHKFSAYDATYNWPAYPPVPEPYETFDQAVSYGPEGHPAMKKEGK